ncbi:MAG: biopolymer transporter ExbD [Chitinivibrionales bacterium]|nr:biopolymer transporter ExbD [Chitinivibrionales bacterium]MBD3356323.1 biopolymer transporter ExbD [Chitinivibrionales bacterium]
MRHESEAAEINMGPLIDMVFILLIFFVVTTNFNRQTGVDVSKPKAQTAVSQGQKTLLVGVTREGTIHVYGRQVTPERLQALVKQEVTKNPEMSVVIIADQDAAIGKAVVVMDKCALAGANKVSIAAEQE